MIAQGVQGPYGDAISPVNRLANFVTRTWTDTTFPVGDPRRSNFFPDCDLTNPLANLECGNLSDTNFGSATPSTTIDPGVLNGWAVRPYNWEFSASVQRELVPRVSVDVGYFRRWFGNFAVTDDRNLPPPISPRSARRRRPTRGCPDGGGYAVDGFVDLNPNRATTPPNNFFTLARNYGEQIQVWNGVDFTVNARIRRDLYVQGGVSTGRTLTDNCEILAALPESNPLGLPYCRQQTNFLTQVKFLGRLHGSEIDLQVSGAFQSIPGPQLSANRVILPAQTTLGRAFTNATNKTVNLVEPGTLFGERLNQLDIRFGKLLRCGERARPDLDLYNAFNVSTVLAEKRPTRDASTSGACRRRS